MRHIVSQVMPCTTIIMRRFTPVVSIIADAVGSVLPRGAATIVQRSASSITTAQNARLISTLCRCAHLMSPPQALSQQSGPCYLEQSPSPHHAAYPPAPSFNPASMRSRNMRLPRPRVSATSQNPPDSRSDYRVIHKRSADSELTDAP